MNTLVGLAVIYACKFFFNLNDIAANLIGYGCGFFISYSLNSRWTFRYVGPRFPAFVKFAASILIAYSSNLAVVMAAIDIFGLNSYFAQALGVPAYTVVAYLLSKHFAFVSAVNANRDSGLGY